MLDCVVTVRRCHVAETKALLMRRVRINRRNSALVLNVGGKAAPIAQRRFSDLVGRSRNVPLDLSFVQLLNNKIGEFRHVTVYYALSSFHQIRLWSYL